MQGNLDMDLMRSDDWAGNTLGLSLGGPFEFTEEQVSKKNILSF